ncbi:uncharacterized protein V6R79_006815 [Siganus canaliculatus]
MYWYIKSPQTRSYEDNDDDDEWHIWIGLTSVCDIDDDVREVDGNRWNDGGQRLQSIRSDCVLLQGTTAFVGELVSIDNKIEPFKKPFSHTEENEFAILCRFQDERETRRNDREQVRPDMCVEAGGMSHLFLMQSILYRYWNKNHSRTITLTSTNYKLYRAVARVRSDSLGAAAQGALAFTVDGYQTHLTETAVSSMKWTCIPPHSAASGCFFSKQRKAADCDGVPDVTVVAVNRCVSLKDNEPSQALTEVLHVTLPCAVQTLHCLPSKHFYHHLFVTEE